MKRQDILVAAVAFAAVGLGGCRESSPDEPKNVAADPVVVKPIRTPDDLFAEWESGRFTRVPGKSIRALMDKHLHVTNDGDLSGDVLESLRTTLAAFVGAYTATDFRKYMVFRGEAQMAGPQHPQLRSRIKSLAHGWHQDWGDSPPEDAVGVMQFVWRSYVEGDLPGAGGGPVIEKVNWSSCRLRTGRLSAENVKPQEWDQDAKTESHFLRELMNSPIASVLGGELEKAVPNKASVAEIVTRGGSIMFADFQIVIKTLDVPPHPLIVRLVYDPSTEYWLPLNAVNIINVLPRVFVW